MSITSNTSASSHTAEWDPSCHSPACSNALTCTHYADTPPVLQHTNTRLCVLLVSSLFNLNFHERQKSFYCSHFKTAQTLMDFIRWCCTSSDISFWRNWRVHFPVFLVSVYCLNLCFCHTWLFSFLADYNLLNKLAISHSSVVRRAYEVIPDHGSIFGHCLLNAYPQSNWRKWCSGKEKKQLWRLLFLSSYGKNWSTLFLSGAVHVDQFSNCSIQIWSQDISFYLRVGVICTFQVQVWWGLIDRLAGFWQAHKLSTLMKGFLTTW